MSTTLACLHEAGIVWGDAKAANILVDMDDNAWIIDFGGGYTWGWVGKDHMETIEGDQEGLSKIKELLNQEYLLLSCENINIGISFHHTKQNLAAFIYM